MNLRHFRFAFVLASAALACRGAQEASGPPAMPVKIQVARAVAVDDTSEYVATLRSRGSAAIMPQVEGHITAIFARSGARVPAGAALMQIDPVKQEAAVSSQQDTRAARQAALQFARQEFERVRGLQASGIASQQDLDRAKTALDSAQADLSAVEAQVREQQAQLRYYRVTSPVAGVVGDIPVRVGDRVTVGTLLTTVDSPGLMEVYLYVPVERAGGLRLGLPVRIVDSTGHVVAESHVTFISPQVEDRTQTLLVKAGLARPASLRPAQFIRARVVWGTRQTPTVPVLAVSRISGQHFAFVAEEEKGALVARQKPIQVGEIVGNDYVVRTGVAPGDRVIVSGTQFLRDGAPVTPQS
jgi:RND family efflux transporter MFP subunit